MIFDFLPEWSKNSKNSSVIFNSLTLKMMRLFRVISGDLIDTAGLKMDTFKRKLDKWLLMVPDTPIIDNYKVAAESNSIVHQAAYRRNEK